MNILFVVTIAAEKEKSFSKFNRKSCVFLISKYQPITVLDLHSFPGYTCLSKIVKLIRTRIIYDDTRGWGLTGGTMKSLFSLQFLITI